MKHIIFALIALLIASGPCFGAGSQLLLGAGQTSSTGPPPPPTAPPVYLSAVNTLNSVAGATIPNGGSALLTWESAGASSCTGTGFSTASFVSGTATVSPTTTTTYTVTCGTNSASATVTVSGNLITATNSCAANGGGNGTSATPWHAACIQAAVNAASNGDTVLLAGGNWTLNTTTDALVSIRKAIALVGVGSGNTFDTYGHINNANGTSSCPTAGTSITCIYQTGTNYTLATNPNPATAGKGIIVFGTIGAVQYSDTACANDTVAHINIDGSQKTAGGDYFGIFQFQSCAGPITVQDIRHLTIALSLSTETQLYSHQSQDVLFRDSMMGNPLVSGSYGWGQAFEPVFNNRITFINNTFWQGTLNSTGDASVVYTGNTTDASLINTTVRQAAVGVTGCQLGATCPTDTVNPNPQGSYHATFTNNYNIGGTCTGCMFALGNGVNDPTTNGNYSDLHFTGNWLTSDKVGVDACMWTLSTDQGNCNGGGMSSNAQANNSCVLSNNGDAFAITNNSLIGTSVAELNATPGGGTMPCFDTANPPSGSGVAIALQVYNYTAQNNYLSSPTNQAPTSAASFNRTVISNFCSGSTFTQSDSTTCATTGFTTLPTVAFTLGTYSNGVVQFASTSFTAQYGAVQWIASTSSTTPLTSDSRWNHVPPTSLSGITHGNTTIYMWVMDSANNISLPASASIVAPSSGGSVQVPGPSAALFNTPYYTCVTNRYVADSGHGGSDSNDGTAATTGGGHGPWLTLGHANTTIPSPAPGYCINIVTGSTITSGTTITHGGNLASSTGYVVYRCQTLDGCTITDLGGAFNIQNNTNYVWIDGITITATSNSQSNGVAINVISCSGQGSCNGTPTFSSHHIWATNNIISNYGQGGFGFWDGEYAYLVHNKITLTSTVPGCGFGGSASSFGQGFAVAGYSRTADDANNIVTGNTGNVAHNFAMWNVMYNNYNNGTNCTDGEGVIIDNYNWGCNVHGGTCGTSCSAGGSCNYTGGILVAFNVTYNNGGPGVHCFFSEYCIFANNSVYNNNLDSGNGGSERGGVTDAGSYGSTYINNVAYALCYSAGTLNNNKAVDPAGPYNQIGPWTTTLSAAITTTTATSVSIASAADMPTGTGKGAITNGSFTLPGGNMIKIDNEVFLVTAGWGATTLTVQRGFLGTTAVTHTSGTTVTWVPNYWSNNITFAASAPSGGATCAQGDGSGTATTGATGEIYSSVVNKINTAAGWADVGRTSIGTISTQPNGTNFALCTAATAPNAACTGASPAVGYGTITAPFNFLPAQAVDAGACSISLTTCP